MGGHVHAEHGGHVATHSGRRHEQQPPAAQQPRNDAARRPVVAAAAQAQHTRHIQPRDDDCGRAEDQIETPVEQNADQGWRSVEAIADFGLGDRGPQDGRRWRRRAAQPDGNAESEPENRGLDQRQPDQHPVCTRLSRMRLQRSNSTATLPPANDAQHAQRDEFDHHQPPVRRGQQVGRQHPHQGIHHTADPHRHPAAQRDRGEAPCRQVGVVSAAQGVGQQRQQTTGPQAGGHQVDQQAVGGQVVRAAGRRVTSQPERDEGHQRSN